MRAAEAMYICTHPTFVQHTERELTAIVLRALRERRGPSSMVAEILAQGRRSLVEPRIVSDRSAEATEEVTGAA